MPRRKNKLHPSSRAAAHGCMAAARLNLHALLALACYANVAHAEPAPPLMTNAESSAHAQEEQPEHRLVWDPVWPRFRPIGYALTGASVLGAIAVTVLIPYPDDARWTGGILFDKAGRSALRARSPGLRDGIRVASDITLVLGLAQTLLLDSLILPFADGSPDVAAQLTLINAQALALSTLVTTLLFKAAARARPVVADCARDPNFDPLCKADVYASFPSSHASTAFTAAGLTCVHHAYLPIYGGPWDLAACAESLALATATAMFRVVGDRHYLTDVITGAAIGFSIGYVYPVLFHYRFNTRDRAAARSSFAVMPAPPYGLSVLGNF
jgi:membrane-associated phospholipid phosphatase